MNGQSEGARERCSIHMEYNECSKNQDVEYD
jgi:hypothetical protein